MKTFILSLGLLCSVVPLSAQINAYARLSGVSGTTLFVDHENESWASFTAGKAVVVMQMQDDVIGSNTANDASFGDLHDIKSAGLYEIRTIASVERILGDLVSIELDQPLANTFNFGENSSVQAISFELLGGGGDFTTTAAIAAMPWNGELGGVLAFEVGGVLTVEHNITADHAGFRGGLRDLTNSGSCDVTTFRSANTDRYAYKGEGIHRNTNANWETAMGKLLNGGGGGNDHNGGGGGGGNFTAGGLAGPGYSCGGNSAGGSGGIALGGHISAQRVFMGGGGGGGEGNDDVSTDGGRGGGIILIKAQQVRTVGTGADVRISADGASVTLAGNDGGGGGGAGGSIVIEAFDIVVSPNRLLTLRANGGNGGSVNHTEIHGGGGGGGQGAVLSTVPLPVSNLTVQTNNGEGGCNDNRNPCVSQAGPGTGSHGMGLVNIIGSPLPVELLSFDGRPDGRRVELTWTTATEQGNAWFVVERSASGTLWQEVARLQGAGSSLTATAYLAHDEQPLAGMNFYRLVQEDWDGKANVGSVVAVHMAHDGPGIVMYPNPARHQVQVRLEDRYEGAQWMLNDGSGRVLLSGNALTNTFPVDVSGFAPGIYVLQVQGNGYVEQQRLVVTR